MFLISVHPTVGCITYCFACTGESSDASPAQEEIHVSQIELLSDLRNAPEGQPQHGSCLGPSSAVLRSLPAAVDFFRNCSIHHPYLRIQVLMFTPFCEQVLNLIKKGKSVEDSKVFGTFHCRSLILKLCAPCRGAGKILSKSSEAPLSV